VAEPGLVIGLVNGEDDGVHGIRTMHALLKLVARGALLSKDL
jgi:hypothetical protein